MAYNSQHSLAKDRRINPINSKPNPQQQKLAAAPNSNSAMMIKNYNSDMEVIEPGIASAVSDYLSEHLNDPESETMVNISKKYVVPRL